MNDLIEAESFNNLYISLCSKISSSYDHLVQVRGKETKELQNCTLILKNPRNRCLTLEKRNTNFGFAVGEFLWYLYSRNDLKTMLFFNKRMKDFSDDNITLNSSYGCKIFSPQYLNLKKSQFYRCANMLNKDSNSRGAVISIWSPGDDKFGDSKDVPCTLNFVFSIRKNKLDMYVHMRSNDIVWGLTYDLFSFTLFHECMLSYVNSDLKAIDKSKKRINNYELGTYTHFANSMHVYKTHYSLIDDIKNDTKKSLDNGSMLSFSNNFYEEINILENEYDLLIKHEGYQIDNKKFKDSVILFFIEHLNNHRKVRDEQYN